MREYASVTLSMLEYAGIYLKKQSSEYGTILNVSDAVHSMRSLAYSIRLVSSYRDRRIQNTQAFKMQK